jgi:3-hydroxyisobutyrate dehydrogenase
MVMNGSACKIDAATRIGWIGTGVMGAPMAGHLLAAGYALEVHSRTRSKASGLLAAGAAWRESPAELASACEVIFTMLGFPEDVQAVYLGGDGLCERIRDGGVLVDMTTTTPSLAVQIAERAARRGVLVLDAPVSGGDVGARNATLAIMVGGDRSAVQRVTPLFEQLGKTIVYQGGAGSGQHAKMCNQIVIAGTMIGMCEALLYAARAGLTTETMLEAIRGGAAGCWSLDNYAPRILQRDFDPGFYVEHFIKDLGIALAEAERMNLALPGLALAHQLYVAVKALGHGRSGTQALTLALEQLSPNRI